MRLSNIFIFLLFLSIASCDTAGNVDPVFDSNFIKYYGSEGNQSAADIQVNPDGSMFLLGNSESVSGLKTAFIIKTDAQGNIIRQRQIGGIDYTAVDVELIKTGNDSGSIVVALNVGPQRTSSILLLKLTQDGITTDSVLVPMHGPGGIQQVAKSITHLELTDEFVVTGFADQKLVKETSPVTPANDTTDILAFRFDNSLALIDTVVNKGGERNGSGIKVFELPGSTSGKLVLFSYSDRPYLEDTFGYNFSFDIVSAGVPVGELIGTEQDQEILSSVVKIPLSMGAGFLMAGTSRPSRKGNGDLYLVKFNDELQYKALDIKLSLGRNLECVAADNAPSGYFILSNEMSVGGLKDIALFKVLSDGSVQWSKSFGSRAGDDSAAAIATLADGRIAIVGTIELQTKRKLALIIVNSDGNF
jgi:hypothetical protein